MAWLHSRAVLSAVDNPLGKIVSSPNFPFIKLTPPQLPIQKVAEPLMVPLAPPDSELDLFFQIEACAPFRIKVPIEYVDQVSGV